jgi:hypothetical protein
VTTVLLVLAMFSVWANRLLFNPDNWSATSTQLLANPDIRSATSNYLVDQLYANVDVAGLLKQGLPPRLEPLAAPAAGALRNVAVQGVNLALSRPRVQNLWAQANRAADQAFIAVVNGHNGRVGVNQGVVTLNLGTILDNIASRLGISADITSKLPPDVATLTIFKSNQLKFIQDVGKAIKGLALLLTILVPLLYALAVLLDSGHRRRTLMTIGWSVILAGVLVLLGRHILETQIASSLTNDESLRPAITATIAIGTQILKTIGGAVIFTGLLLVLAGWFAGPARWARTVREALAPYLRENPLPSYGVALGLLALLFIWQPIPAMGTPAGIITFTALGLFGVFLLRRQTAEEFPDAVLGTASAKIRARIQEMRHGHGSGGQPSDPAPGQSANPPRPPIAGGAPAPINEQLQHLSDLRDAGKITTEEYQAAKRQLLGV